MSGSEAVTEKPSHSLGRLRAAVARRLTIGRSVLRGGANYMTNLVWLLMRSIEERKLTVAGVFALGQLSVGAQAAALGALYWYAAQAQSDAVVSLGPFGVELRAREDLWLLGAVVAGSAVCFLGSALFLYLSQRTVIGIGEEDLARRLTEVIRIARRLPDPRAPDASRIVLKSGLTKVNLGCRVAASSTVALLSAVTPLVGGVVAAAVLLVIDPVLTSMLGIAAALWCTLLYPSMKRQVKIPDRMVRGKLAFTKESRALLQSPLEAGVPETLSSAVTLAEVMIGRRRIANDIKVLLQTGVAVIGTLAALYLAYRIIDGNGDWPIFIVYLGGLRIAVNGCFAVPRTFGTVSQRYSRLVVFIQFIQSGRRIDEEQLGHAGRGGSVALGALPDGTSVGVRGGDRIALAAVAGPQLVQAAFVQARASATGRPLASAWVQPADSSACAGEDIPIRLVEAEQLFAMEPTAAQAFLDRFDDGVTAIVYRDEARVGKFGERHLLVVDDDTFQASVPLGTAESRMALASFADVRARVDDKAGRATGVFGVSMDDEEDEEA